MPAPTYAVQLVAAEYDVGAFQEHWDRLSAIADPPNIFTSYDWFRIWYRRFAEEAGPKRCPHVLVLKRNGTVCGISPLIRMVSWRYGFPLRRLHFVAREWDYNDLVLGDDIVGQTEAVVKS